MLSVLFVASLNLSKIASESYRNTSTWKLEIVLIITSPYLLVGIAMRVEFASIGHRVCYPGKNGVETFMQVAVSFKGIGIGELRTVRSSVVPTINPKPEF